MGAQGARNVDSGNEWGTPWAVVEQAMGMLAIEGFDLDPAATADNAKAANHYTKEDNGLEKEWFGHVWLNPPFSRSLSPCKEGCVRKGCEKRGFHLDQPQHGAQDFAKKAVLELSSGRVAAIAWHGPVAPDTSWYRDLWPFIAERADYNGRIAYNGGKSGGTFPSQTLILVPHGRTTATVPTMLLDVPSAKGAHANEPVGEPGAKA